MTDTGVRAGRPEVGASVIACGIRTNYLEAGSGEPVVLVHGSGPGVSAYANWRLTLPALAERFHVFAPDMVGFGFTERPIGIEYGIETWTDHLIGFLDGLGIRRAHLVGNSFGGAIALRAALRHPDRVGRLVLMGSVGLSFPITPGLDAVWGYRPSPENIHEAYAAMFPAPRQRWVDALASPEDAIARLPHETLLVHGLDDRVIPVEESLRLLRLIPDARLHIFNRCGHWTQIERGEEFTRLLTSFLSRPGAGRIDEKETHG